MPPTAIRSDYRLKVEQLLTLSELEPILAELGTMRKSIPIQECEETLKELPREKFSFEYPHPYKSVGATYGEYSPFHVRHGVLQRLLEAQEWLNEERPGHKLHIFDAYRPVSVQAYMVNFTREQVAIAQGFQPETLTAAQEQQVMNEVFKLWAKPSIDPTQPPPHSTGSAIDLSIVDEHGVLLDMGSAFDELSDRMLPHYYRNDTSAHAQKIHDHRECLNRVMTRAGFMRLTHEWWHFSYGDQTWALLKQMIEGDHQPHAHYGAISEK